jgi:hypothetical protein
MNRRIDEWIVEADLAGMQAAMKSGAVSSQDRSPYKLHTRNQSGCDRDSQIFR